MFNKIKNIILALILIFSIFKNEFAEPCDFWT